VNAHGDVLVELDDAAGDAQSGVLIHGGAVTRIPGLGGSPPANQGGPLVLTGLNDRDQVVGYGYTRRGAGRRTFVWRSGRTTLLPTRDGVQPPWGAPVQLNDAGQVLGTMYVAGSNGHSRQRGVLWRP
jgi:hypothetical protein